MYKELQIHGPLLLERDVAALFLHPVDSVQLASATAFSERTGIPLVQLTNRTAAAAESLVDEVLPVFRQLPPPLRLNASSDVAANP
jgi:hypothetical protein